MGTQKCADECVPADQACELSDWSVCSDTCEQTRTIKKEAGSAGTPCDETRTQKCADECVPAAQTCVLSDWSVCSDTCEQTRTITQKAGSAAPACGSLTQKCADECVPVPADQACVLSDWSECSDACKQTRTITQKAGSDATPCESLTQECAGGKCVPKGDDSNTDPKPACAEQTETKTCPDGEKLVHGTGDNVDACVFDCPTVEDDKSWSFPTIALPETVYGWCLAVGVVTVVPATIYYTCRYFFCSKPAEEIKPVEPVVEPKTPVVAPKPAAPVAAPAKTPEPVVEPKSYG